VKWELTLYRTDNPGRTTMVFEAETADEARRIAMREVKSKNAAVYELEKLD